MDKIRLGKTELMVSRSGFGAIPIQRISDEDSTTLLRAAFAGGINFYDTARGYSTSEHKIGLALGHVRKDIIIATKSGAETGEELEEHLETSLAQLGTDYIDIYQFHNPAFFPRPGDANGVYDAALRAKAAGKIRHIGVTNHRLALAKEMAQSGLFETVQFPMSSLATDDELELVHLCKAHDVGFIAMKGLAGGLIINAKTTFAFLRQLGNVVPIWGMQLLSQLEEFLRYEQNPPALDEEIWKQIHQDRKTLAGDFCRACGYCQPCPVGIVIPAAARMEVMLGRADWRMLSGEYGQEIMGKVKDCVECGRCRSKCPYKLDVPALLKANLAFFEDFCSKL
ncbi:MAG: aldo/keto reductase [Deltaproteobacteria bacterium]|jgi:predicted aldo/keto reductase-like oxidoreductase|nr:aldo/keto reductase [Deltaproteobacteria bacterium]